MTDENRTDEGQFDEQYSTSSYFEAIRSQDDPTTADVADRVGCTRRNALDRLRKLEKQGQVRSRKIGNANVWEIV